MENSPLPTKAVSIEAITSDSDELSRILTAVLGARQSMRYAGEDGVVMHLSLVYGSHCFMGSTIGCGGPTAGLASSKPHVRLGTVFATAEEGKKCWESLLAAGAKVICPYEQQFWGSHYGIVQDPQGLLWSIGEGTQAPRDIPKEHLRAVVPQIFSHNAPAYIDFLKQAFNATELYPPVYNAEGLIGHCELGILGGLVFVSHGCDIQGSDEAEIQISLEVEDAKATADKFVAQGGKVGMPVERQHWGQVYGTIDCQGLNWAISEKMLPPNASS